MRRDLIVICPGAGIGRAVHRWSVPGGRGQDGGCNDHLSAYSRSASRPRKPKGPPCAERKIRSSGRRRPLPEHGNHVDLRIVAARVRVAGELRSGTVCLSDRPGDQSRNRRFLPSSGPPATAASGATTGCAPAREERPRPRRGWNRRTDQRPFRKRTGGKREGASAIISRKYLRHHLRRSFL